ncbi:hypothetical protein DSO57_1027210 [Entomophthora muscae]|uniref:Uncharacterized protein n=1 Tax=Entomophthora muscae TaxID=34485 RepID=A0ACC2UBA3_9FUNG|nr:hypothetical protein DSO57_1027210 [Entomophthora muscae]
MLTRLSISFVLLSRSVTLIQADNLPLKLGENQIDSFYRLPEGTKWNGIGDFRWTHFLAEAGEHDPNCEENGDKTTCIWEVERSILVEYGGKDFPSHCWYEDCEIDVKTPSLRLLFVDMYNITDAPLLNFSSPPFYPQTICSGSKIRMLAPGKKRFNLRLYNIYLLIKLEQTTFLNDTYIDTKNYTVKALGLLDDHRCNSFVTHRYISNPNNL